MSEKNQGLQYRGKEPPPLVGTLLLGNDKDSVIVNKVLSYFYCLGSKFEVYVACFRTK